jgi:hypothetical protein
METESCAVLFWAAEGTAMVKGKRANAPDRRFFNFTSSPLMQTKQYFTSSNQNRTPYIRLAGK